MTIKNRVFEYLLTAWLLLFVMAFPAAAQSSTPTFTAIDPTSGVRGTSVAVTLTGTRFSEPMTIAATWITATNIHVVDDKTATADFTIAAGTPPGLQNIVITTPGGTTTGARFTVVPPPPTFSGINPTFGTQGTSISVTLSGNDFVTGLKLSGADITASSISVLNATTATANLVIAASAVVGPHDLTVTTSGGTSEVLSFTVVAAPEPTLVSISPEAAIQDSTLSISLKGTNFFSGLTISELPGITITGVNVVDSTTATANFKIAADAELGAHDVTITTLGGTTAAIPFTTFAVFAVAPTLTSIAPASGSQGTTAIVTLTGSNFSSGLSVIADGGITASSVSVTSASTATATLTIDPEAGVGSHSINVATPGGVSGAVVFRVDLPPPALTGIDPAEALVGTSADVTLFGSNLATGLSINAGSNIAVSNIVVVDSTSATATFTVGIDASPGDRTVTVSTATGSATVTFTVVPLPPTLTSISPASFVQINVVAQTIPVTLTGTNLHSPSLAITGSGVTLTNIRSISAASAIALLTVEADTELGPREITLTTRGGTTSAVTFTIVPPIPELTKLDPAIGIRGTSATVNLTGQYFASGVTTVEEIPGITVSGLAVASGTSATATFAVSADAAIGVRQIRLTTPVGTSAPLTFTVADPFPDVAIGSSHEGNFGVGFNETYTIAITNVGTLPTTGPVTVTDVLPTGLTFVSGIGPGWTCSASGPTVTCSNNGVFQPLAPSRYVLTVAVGSNAASAVNHRVSVAAAGDLNAANDFATDVTNVNTTPSPTLTFDPSPLVVGEQASVAINLPSNFPHDVTGTLSMTFKSNAVIPLDDPAIQFATGGRTVNFTIPANTTQAIFDSQSGAGPLSFQSGTVAGSLTFKGMLAAGAIQKNFSPSGAVAGGLRIPIQAPMIDSIQTSNQNGFVASITLSSTPREVNQLTLTFNTKPKVSLSCGASPGCSTSGQTLTLDVQTFFTNWFTSDTVYGSLSVLHVPLSVAGGKVRGTVDVNLTNGAGVSNTKSFNLP